MSKKIRLNNHKDFSIWKNTPVMKKTDHFLLRQWERGLSDSLLDKISQEIICFEKGKTIYLIRINTLKRFGEQTRKNLVLIMNGTVAITLYFIDSLPDFFANNNKQKKVQFKII